MDTSLKEIIEYMKELIVDFSSINKRMLEMAPGMTVQMEGLINLPQEEVLKAIDQLSESIPEEDREDVLVNFCKALEGAKKYCDETKWRLDRRVHKEGEDRTKPKFKSFCRRKGEW